MADEKRLLNILTDIVLDCEELEGDDQLLVLQLAWWAAASNMRCVQIDDAARIRACHRQAAIFDLMSDWLRGDTSDPELERLWLQADHEGMVKRLRRDRLVDQQ